jgi:hypothetical protein
MVGDLVADTAACTELERDDLRAVAPEPAVDLVGRRYRYLVATFDRLSAGCPCRNDPGTAAQQTVPDASPDDLGEKP